MKEKPTITQSEFDSHVTGIRQCWSNDVRKMMKLWESHQRLISVLDMIAKDNLDRVSPGIKTTVRAEIAKAMEVQI